MWHQQLLTCVYPLRADGNQHLLLSSFRVQSCTVSKCLWQSVYTKLGFSESQYVWDSRARACCPRSVKWGRYCDAMLFSRTRRLLEGAQTDIVLRWGDNHLCLVYPWVHLRSKSMVDMNGRRQARGIECTDAYGISIMILHYFHQRFSKA